MSQNPSTQTKVGDNPEPLDGGSPQGSSLFATNDLAEICDTGLRTQTTSGPTIHEVNGSSLTHSRDTGADRELLRGRT
ncbi:hypothetical protein E4U15_001914 [Claviceps sp. LM218 group G6]|nr:hypothetical protein E4U15_001914 [Claviceps sp. LM218 group G6]